MSIAVADTYVFDRSETDHARLTSMAYRLSEVAREACLRAGLRPGIGPSTSAAVRSARSRCWPSWSGRTARSSGWT